MTSKISSAKTPRIEDFRSDLTKDEIDSARFENVRALAMQAYIFALPAFLHMRQLTEFIQARRMMAPNENPLGGWILIRKLSDATTNNNAPNVDTLYGASYVFLKEQGPVVLSVPPIPDRYYSLEILDAYFNNFANVSPRTFGNKGGNYLIAPPDWSGTTPQGIDAVFIAPTSAVSLYQRIFTRDESEYQELHQLQNAITLSPLATWGTSHTGFPPVDLSAFEIQNMRMTTDPLQFFKYTNFYTGINRPPEEDAGLMALFQAAGVGPGSELPTDPLSQDAIREGASLAQRVINANISKGPFRDGWRIPDPKAGKAGPHFLSRAVTQLTQIGSFNPVEAMYFFANRDAMNQPLTGKRRYTLTFTKDNLPPINDLGFWSVTMYNEKLLLIANPLNRYMLRPSSPGLQYDEDGSLTLYLQAEKPVHAPVANWLPTGENNFTIALRAYLPKSSLLDGIWFPPAVQPVENSLEH